jgi:hypothetical protein
MILNRLITRLLHLLLDLYGLILALHGLFLFLGVNGIYFGPARELDRAFDQGAWLHSLLKLGSIHLAFELLELFLTLLLLLLFLLADALNVNLHIIAQVIGKF